MLMIAGGIFSPRNASAYGRKRRAGTSSPSAPGYRTCEGSTSVAGSIAAGSERVSARASIARSPVTNTSHGRDGLRSEERRVGKEWRARWAADAETKQG